MLETLCVFWDTDIQMSSVVHCFARVVGCLVLCWYMNGPALQMSSWLCSVSMNYAPAKIRSRRMDVNTKKVSNCDYEVNDHPQHRHAFGVSALLCYCISQTLIQYPCFELLWLLYLFFFYLAQQSPVGQGLLIHEVSVTHNDALQSVGLLWTGD
jgi:hypothetical protein